MTEKPTYEDLEEKIKFLKEEMEKCRRVERAYREREEQYRAMMVAMDDMVYVCSSDFRVEYMNPAMIRRTGYDATGEFCYKVFHGYKERCPWCVHRETMEGKTSTYEVVSPKDGRSFHISNAPIFHADGGISKMAVIRDVTEFNRVKKMLQGVVDESPVGIAIYDSAGQCIMANDAHGEIIGATREQVLEQNWHHIESWKECGLYETALQTLKEKCRKQVEFSIASTFGKEVVLNRYLVPFDLGNGLCLLVMTEDITERKRAEVITKQLEARVLQNQKAEIQGELLGDIALEFEDLLFPIIESSVAAIDLLPENSASSKNLGEILKYAEQAKELMGQIVTIGCQLSCHNKKALAVQTVVAKELALLRGCVPANIEIKDAMDNRCRPANIDTIHIRRVVKSLLKNAANAIGNQDGCISVGLSEVGMGGHGQGHHMASSPQYCILLSVSVTVAKNRLEDDLCMENQLTKITAAKGTCVSFAAVHAIVRACGGELRIQGELDGDSTVDAYLPGLSAAELKEVGESVERPRKGTGPERGEDDKQKVDRIREMVLEELGLK